MPTRLLLVADDAFDDARAVSSCVRQVTDDASHVHVVAPVIASRLDVMTEDEEAYAEARDRATRVVDELRERGIEAEGEYSTEDPYDAAVSGLRAGDFDGLVVATTGEGHWREEGLLERLRDATEVPVTVVTVDDGER